MKNRLDHKFPAGNTSPHFLVLFLAVLFMNSATAQHSRNNASPVSIIFDTDMGPDYDDVGAIALLHAMADSGECNILATMASNQHKRVAAVLSVFNTSFKRPSIPIGVVRGHSGSIESFQKWDSVIAERYPHAIKNNNEAEDALVLYRKILAGQPDSSVTIVTVGFLTNMFNLLESRPDHFSNLNGYDLVRKKVKRLVCMAGRFGSEYGKFREFNVKMDSVASKNVFDYWPTSILFSGFEIGATIHTGLPLIYNTSITNSPVKDVFSISIPLDPNDRNGRMSWDETAVLVAIRGYQNYFDLVPGNMITNSDGSNGWDASGNKDAYLVPRMQVAALEQILNELIMHQPKTK